MADWRVWYLVEHSVFRSGDMKADSKDRLKVGSWDAMKIARWDGQTAVESDSRSVA
jgi:hypothetical protein